MDNYRYTDNEDNRKLADAVGDALLGSCADIDQVLADTFNDPDATIMDFEPSLLHRVEEITVQCECCGWWVESGTVNDNGECEDCADDQEDYE